MMKKYTSRILILFSLFLGLLSAVLFSSCDGVIFYEIRQEVKLADAEIGGDIQNIIRYGSDIYIANGEIKYRSVDSSVVDQKLSWTALSVPDSSAYVYSLAADSSNLYALAVIIEEDDDGYNTATKRILWAYDGSSWTQIWSASYSSTYAFIICTNSVVTANRKAFFRYGATVYELSGSSIDTSSPTYVYQNSTGGSTYTDQSPVTADSSKTVFYPISCASLGGTVYFSSGKAMTSNADDSVIYYSSGSYVYSSTDGSTWNSVSLNCDTILSMAVTSDYFLAGTTDGIVHSAMSGTAPVGGNSDFSTNAASTLSSYYEIQAVLAVDPTKTETGGTLFATSITSSSSASRKNVGLWSYFTSTRQWNRE